MVECLPTVAGASIAGLGYVAGSALYWMAANPATTINAIRTVGISVSEAVTEQQLTFWGGAMVLGGKGIQRLGRYGDDIFEINIEGLVFHHKIPRNHVEKPLEHIDDLISNFMKDGFDLKKAPHVIEVNGEFIITDGHHRVAAMHRAGEETTPARVFNWNKISKEEQEFLLDDPELGEVIQQALNNGNK